MQEQFPQPQEEILNQTPPSIEAEVESAEDLATGDVANIPPRGAMKMHPDGSIGPAGENWDADGYLTR